ncbi:uncharacterized protein LOC132198163 [Neocloeon triangulifer]|uniref:uncharacterized protein LOC132198163 n=1 Tax=Neocloeon triangulifer TaxID=2078957 RepID=UPI00286F3977|nr:uncharacterized protein LOC132198163 [Neocloeon triangulifer]
MATVKMDLFGAAKVTVLTASVFPISCLLSYWENHIPTSFSQQVLISPSTFLSTLLLTSSTILMILVVKTRESYVREVFRKRPDLRLQGWMTFDPMSVSCFSTWTAVLGLICSIFVAHGALEGPVVHDALVVCGAIGFTLYLTAQVGLSYTMGDSTARKVARFRNFLRWCCLFVLTVWLIVSIVVTNEVHLGRKSLGEESIQVLRVVCLLAEASVLLLLSAFVASFVHEFQHVSVQIVKVTLAQKELHQVKVEKQKIFAPAD